MSTEPSAAFWKGKATAVASGTSEDFLDLNPPITYRQLLSPPIGARDPLRVIALCDSDAFYAACEQTRLGIDPEKPLVVRQWDALIAVNYPARKYGITRMAKWHEALKKCPELIVVHVATYKEGDPEPGYWDNPDTNTHKVSLDYYRRESAKIITIFKEGLPDGEIEKASIDEAFIDFTRPVRKILLERYPYLATVPPDAPDGLDTVLPPPPSTIEWEPKSNIIPVYPLNTSEPVQPAGDIVVPETERESEMPEDEVVDVEPPPTWHDVALSIAAELMDKIRADVRSQLSYTTSAGIARNKFLAKLSASYKKRDSQNVLRNAAIPNYLRPMPFQKIRFLGGKLGKALADEYDVSTVGDLLTISLEEMQRKFGEEAIWVYEILRGIDRSEVKEKPAMAKSMMASKNLPRPITSVAEGPHWLRVLAAELALRLNEARTEHDVWPKTIVLHIRHGWEPARSRQTAFPFVRNITVDAVAAVGNKLWKELVAPPSGKPETPLKVRYVALGFTGLEAVENGQKGIESFLHARPPGSTGTGSKPSSRQGSGSSSTSSTLKRKRSSSQSTISSKPFPNISGGSSTNDAHDSDALPSTTDKPAVGDSFMCDQCRKRVFLDGDYPAETIEEREERLVKLRSEHEDYHVALELSKMPGLKVSTQRPSTQAKDHSSKKPKKKQRVSVAEKKEDTEGIARFFTKR